MYTLLFKMGNNQGPAVEHRELRSCYTAAWKGGRFGGEEIHVYVWLGHFAVYLKLLQHF